MEFKPPFKQPLFNAIFIVVTLVITSGTISYLFNYATSNNELDFKKDGAFVEYVVSRLDKSDEQNEALIIQNRELIRQVNKLRDDVRSCKTNTLLMTAIKTDIPIMIWMKDKVSVVIYLNDLYGEQILRPLGFDNIDLLYTKGYHIFGKEVVDNFIVNDLEAMNSAVPIFTIEYLYNSKKEKEYLLVCKAPRMLAGKRDGTIGFAIKLSYISNLLVPI